MILFSAKSKNLFSVVFNFSTLLMADSNSTENLIEFDDSRITQHLGTHYDCSLAIRTWDDLA